MEAEALLAVSLDRVVGLLVGEVPVGDGAGHRTRDAAVCRVWAEFKLLFSSLEWWVRR